MNWKSGDTDLLNYQHDCINYYGLLKSIQNHVILFFHYPTSSEF